MLKTQAELIAQCKRNAVCLRIVKEGAEVLRELKLLADTDPAPRQLSLSRPGGAGPGRLAAATPSVPRVLSSPKK
jgi:hypothetical protein